MVSYGRNIAHNISSGQNSDQVVSSGQNLNRAFRQNKSLLRRQSDPAFRAPCFNNGPAVLSRHACTKPMGTFTTKITRLKSTFHDINSLIYRTA
jgi:hypothetical protein